LVDRRGPSPRVGCAPRWRAALGSFRTFPRMTGLFLPRPPPMATWPPAAASGPAAAGGLRRWLPPDPRQPLIAGITGPDDGRRPAARLCLPQRRSPAVATRAPVIPSRVPVAAVWRRSGQYRRRRRSWRSGGLSCDGDMSLAAVRDHPSHTDAWPVPSAPSLRAGPASRPACASVWRGDGTSAAMVLALRVTTHPG